jgi:hypothetical protein
MESRDTIHHHKYDCTKDQDFLEEAAHLYIIGATWELVQMYSDFDLELPEEVLLIRSFRNQRQITEGENFTNYLNMKAKGLYLHRHYDKRCPICKARAVPPARLNFSISGIAMIRLNTENVSLLTVFV